MEPVVTFVILSMALLALTAAMVRPALAGGSGLLLTGFDGTGVILAFSGFVAVALVLGPVFSFALMLAFLLHEFGHVVAYRLAGHTDVRFRLIPIWDGARISNQAPRSDLDAFFIALMGPGVSLAPMVVSFALSEVLLPLSPATADLFWQFALATGVLNFVSLLPLWPFDGGRCIRIMLQSIFPNIGPLAAMSMSVILAALAILLHSVMLCLIALVGAISLVAKRGEPSKGPPLTLEQLRLALAAYFAALASFFLAGWWVLKAILTII